MPAAPDLRLDAAPAPPVRASGRAPGVRTIAAELHALLTDPAFADPALAAWRGESRTLARRFAAAAARGGGIDRDGATAFAATLAGVRLARDRWVRFADRSGELADVLDHLAAADPAAGPRALAFARGVLAGARDRAAAAGPFDPAALVPAAPGTDRARRGLAGGTLAAWVAVQFRTLCGDAEPLVVAALCRDAGELLSPARHGEPEPIGAHADRSAALLAGCRGVNAAARAAACHHERPDGGGPAGVGGDDLAPGDRLVGWCDRFVAELAAVPSPHPDPAAGWRAAWDAAARRTYAAGRRGELCLKTCAAGLEALGLDRGDQGAADAAGVVPAGPALTDLGRTRLRLDPAHALPVPHYLQSPTVSRVSETAGARR